MESSIQHVSYQLSCLLELAETASSQVESTGDETNHEQRSVFIPLASLKSSHAILTIGNLEFPGLGLLKGYGGPHTGAWNTMSTDNHYGFGLGKRHDHFVLSLVPEPNMSLDFSTHIAFLKPFQLSIDTMKPSEWLEDFVNHSHRDCIQLTRSYQSLDTPNLPRLNLGTDNEPASPVYSICFVLRTPTGDKMYRYYVSICFESHMYIIVLQSSDLILFSKNLNAVYKIVKKARPRFDLRPLSEDDSVEDEDTPVASSSSASSRKTQEPYTDCISSSQHILKQYIDAFVSPSLLSFVSPEAGRLLRGPYMLDIDSASKVYPPSVNDSISPVTVIVPGHFSQREKINTFFAFLEPFSIPYFAAKTKKGHLVLQKIRETFEEGYDCVCESNVELNPLLFPNTPYPATDKESRSSLVQACVIHHNLTGKIVYQLYVVSLYPKNLDMFASDAAFLVQCVVFRSHTLAEYSQYRNELFWMLENAKWTGAGIVSSIELRSPISPYLRFEHPFHDGDEGLDRLDSIRSGSSYGRKSVKKGSSVRNSRMQHWIFGVLVYPDAIEGIFMGQAVFASTRKERPVFLVFTYSGHVVFGIPENGILSRFKIEDLSTDQQLDTGSYEFNPATESLIVSRITSFDSDRYPSAVYAEATLVDSNILMVSGDGFGALDGFVMNKLIGFAPEDTTTQEHFKHLQFKKPPIGKFTCTMYSRETDFIQFYEDGTAFVSDSYVMSFFGPEQSAGWKYKVAHFTLDLISPSMDLASFTIVPLDVSESDRRVKRLMIDSQSYHFLM